MAEKFEREISNLNQSLSSKAHLEQDLETVQTQVTELNKQLETTNEIWARQFDEQKKIQQVLEDRAVKAESLLAESVDKSVVQKLQTELNAAKSAFDNTCKQKDSLANRLAELEAKAKLADSDAQAKLETARAALTRAEELSARRLREADEKANAQLTAINAEYEAKLADLATQAAAKLAEAQEEAAAELAKAKADAAKKHAEVESQAAAKSREAEKKFVAR